MRPGPDLPEACARLPRGPVRGNCQSPSRAASSIHFLASRKDRRKWMTEAASPSRLLQYDSRTKASTGEMLFAPRAIALGAGS